MADENRKLTCLVPRSAENILTVEYLLTIIIFSNFIINIGTVQYSRKRLEII